MWSLCVGPYLTIQCDLGSVLTTELFVSQNIEHPNSTCCLQHAEWCPSGHHTLSCSC